MGTDIDESVIIRCDCCGKEVMAIKRGDKLIITDRRHGQKHFAVFSLKGLTKGNTRVTVKALK